MRKITLKSVLMTALLAMSANAMAQTALYQRGGDGTAWSDADLTEWTATGGITPAIDGGIKVSATNGGWTLIKPFSTSDNSIVTLTATISGGVAPGRDSSYDYIKIGGVSFRLNGQSKVASVDVDGNPSNLDIAFTRGGDYDVLISINKATGVVNYNLAGVEGTSNSLTAIENVEIGHNRGGRENYEHTVILKSITVTEEVQSVTTADYIVKYLFGTTVIKEEAKRTGVVGEPIILLPSDKESIKNEETSTKYIYDSDDTEGSTIAGDGSTVVTVNFREAATYAYSFTATDGTKDLEVKNGSGFEGDEIIVPFGRVINVDGTIYTSNTAGSSPCTFSFILDENDKKVSKNFTPTSNTGVVFFIEAEDIEGVTKANGGGVGIRCSNAAGGYASEAVVVTWLAPGFYTLTAAAYANTTFTFTCGEVTIGELVLSGSWGETKTDVFEVTETSEIKFVGGSGDASALDYIYIQKFEFDKVSFVLGDSESYASYVPAYAADFKASGVEAFVATAADGTEGIVTLESVDAVPAGTPVLVKGTVGNTVEIKKAATAEAPAANLLKAATGAALTENQYVLAWSGTEFVFAPLDDAIELPVGKVYLEVAGASVKAFRIGGTATAVESVKAAQADGRIFNLAGQRVNKAQKGIYVVNGKKVVK